MTPRRTIAVFLPNWVGDAVMATPALGALRRHFADARFVGVQKPYVANVLEGLGWLDDQIFLDSKGPASQRWPSVGLALRRQSIDLAILFPNSFHSAFVAWLGRCRCRVGYARYGRSRLLTDSLRPPGSVGGTILPNPVIDAYNGLAVHLGCPPPGYRMELAITAADEEAADSLWRQNGLDSFAEVICLNPGAAFGRAKCWPAEHFADLAQKLVDQRGCGVVVLCGSNEQDMARQIVEGSRRRHVCSLAGQNLSLGLSKACVRRADLLITTDSGPRHFAAAFDRPVVTLFGPTHIAWTETYFAKAIHLQKRVDCGPCQLRVCPLDHRCMRSLTPHDVFRAASELLMRYPRTRRNARPIAG
jgi:heptosyltransferase-2